MALVVARRTAVVLSRPTKAERRPARRLVGKLSESRVTAATEKRYWAAVAGLFFILRSWGEPLLDCIVAFDLLVRRVIDEAWQEGETRNLIGDLLSGLGHAVLALRNNLKESWRLHVAWANVSFRLGLRQLVGQSCWRCVPLLVCVFVSDVAIVMLVGYLFRTAVMTSMLLRHFVSGSGCTTCYQNLELTKSSGRRGSPEGVGF